MALSPFWRKISALATSAALALFAMQASAKPNATLIADSLSIESNSVLLARGHVEIFYEGQSLRASALRYDRIADKIFVTGPIYLTDGKGTTMLADQAQLSADLSEGILTSARVVLDGQLQMAADQVLRLSDRYTALSRVTASSCKVCAGNPTPLWEIRARRVVHDQDAQQLYFDRAQMRLAGVPVFYIPRLRMPDPTLDRATGFMPPRITSSTQLGFGLRVPYFITLGRHRDVLLTPYLSTKGARGFDLRYRQAFATGDILFDGSWSKDEILLGRSRGIFAFTGAFDLPRDFKLTFRSEAASDPAYLLDYGLDDKDRLDSRIEVARTQRNEHVSVRLIGFHSLRASDDNETLPSLVGDATVHRRFSLGPMGGEGGLRFQLHSADRKSTSGVDGPDTDTTPDGRDTRRASLRADWQRNWFLNNGMILSALGEVRGDLYRLRQDSTSGGTYARGSGAIAAELRWPLVKAGDKGRSQMIEPVVQFVLAPDDNSALPNEDSTLVEFDEGNLFAHGRFPGSDAVEDGLRVNLGVNYVLLDDDFSFGASLGRVLRLGDAGQFNAASGLAGASSDWLTTVQFFKSDGLGATGRFLFDDSLALTKSELRLEMARPRYALQAGVVQVEADATEGRPTPIREVTFAGSYNLTENWTARVSNLYDFEADRATRAGLGLAFKNECLTVDLSLSRRFASSTSVKPVTDFGLSVEFLGFGNTTSAGPEQQCRR